jgi:DNA-binding LacI/PurR family transcriptional regulator
MVAIDRTPGDLMVDTVQVANERAAILATRHFIAEGHRRIGFISGPKKISTSVERLAGYEAALKEAGIPIDPDLAQPGGYSIEGGYQAMRRLMGNHERPTAVLTSNNLMTLGALRYIHENTFDIPGDISFIGYDDMPWASALKPPLSVIAQPETEIGVMAARLMLDRLKDPNSFTKHVTLEARLILRASCTCGARPIPAQIDGSILTVKD